MNRTQILLGAIATIIMMGTIATKANVLGHTLAKAAVDQGCYTALTITNPNNHLLHLQIDATTANPAPGTRAGCFDSPNDGASINIPANPTSLGESALTHGTNIEDPLTTCNGRAQFCCYEVDGNSKVVEICYKP